MARILMENITKTFIDDKRGGTFTAVNDASFEIKDKEFLVFVGPSGCGKTTSLRMIAGLERQTSGNIYIDEKLVNNMHPKDRDIAMVFQDYALYPHMTIEENLAFGLKNMKVSKQEIKEKIDYATKILGLEQLLDRKPKELSGGQRQRVAVGRAIVRDPKVFLFDEPLSNLDAKLRVQMRIELAELHRRLGATIVYVTHDQVEAMTLGERIVVMNQGEIQQIATPRELYRNPANMFVAGFIGSPPMNFFDCVLETASTIKIGDLTFTLPEKLIERYRSFVGKKVVLGLRPEDIYDEEFAFSVNKTNKARMKVKAIEHLGGENLVYFHVGERIITAKVSGESFIRAGEEKSFVFNLEKMHLFDPVTEKRI
ncbi:ABC transporter ATP-binding protein [Sutcliffiella cohnii]|uniref:Sugar ABC transporter ATP-binding protein n=1 Tax=Sutcliffiella cohnii TaxID=33932 RepID=A0A223KUA9_9BACI|nr:MULTISPECIES: sn-glycerol-3-phosphate ABC transporter ATP-binding protein UgpC [Sutcliffiella]AST92913.1 sugar ABC transporter ATP-binding protein [Sutcliffiella cohnii]MED4016129.1 sn-glycerol-3-phosphate ABC transporter ATP-binding protein UgpC [Sutcliffiella cohnii]WBL14172.1 sn-glycerol-3-phosphate ABC transporter ATP-binding protein UgpC [Sutcliffiella sp. NC1]